MKGLKCAAGVAIFTAVLMAALLIARMLAGCGGCDPYWIDYDAPGVDITSEGP